jgi:Tfp pilus assembly protein PilZ
MAEKDTPASTRTDAPSTGKTTESRAPCKVSFVFDQKEGQGTSLHFSERGILVNCDSPLPLNSKLKLVLQFPSFKNTIEVSGEVVWTNVHGSVDSITPRAMGVKFLNVERETERMLVDVAALYGTFGSIYSCYFS